MLKKLLITTITIGALLPFASAFASLWPTGSPYTKSTFYAGAEGGYIYSFNTMRYGPNAGVLTPALKRKVHDQGATGTVFVGYGHIFQSGNLQYLGVEASGIYNTKYNSSSRAVYGKNINARWGVALDVMPGLFFDDAKTTLVYARLGIGLNQYRLSNIVTGRKRVYRPVARAGIGAEHQLNGNFYVRADYVFSMPGTTVKFRVPGDGIYSSKPFMSTFSVGLLYRFD